MDATSAGMTPVQRTTGRFLTIVALLQIGISLQSSNHAATSAEEDFADVSIIIDVILCIISSWRI